MLVLGVLSLIIIGGSPQGFTADSALQRADTGRTAVEATATAEAIADPGPAPLLTPPLDTPRTRPRVIEVSDWYARRLAIHRIVSYATIPVFAAQWVAGERLFKDGREAPVWAKTGHRVGATALAGMFAVNTVTGAWNWWDSRSAKQGRTLRTAHAIAMLAADGAFTYAGARLSNEAETSLDKRKLHRTIALSAMGVTVVSELAMKLWNH